MTLTLTPHDLDPIPSPVFLPEELQRLASVLRLSTSLKKMENIIITLSVCENSELWLVMPYGILELVITGSGNGLLSTIKPLI